MARPVNILVFAGSLRKDSFNTKLARVVADAARAAGADVTLAELNDYDMPLYDGDIEAASGLPAGAESFKKLVAGCDGFIIASPEYNSGYSGVLKNVIDWVSRPSPDAFKGKYAAIVSASPGALGGLRGLFQLREVLQNIAVTVIPAMQAVSKAHEAFDDDGKLKDEKMAAGVANVAQQLVAVLKKTTA